MNPTSTIQEQLAKLRREAEEREAQRKAEKAGLTYVNPITASFGVQIEALKLIPEEKARSLKVAPCQFKKPDLALVIYNPDDPAIKQLIKDFENQGLKVKVFVVSLPGLEYIFDFYKFVIKELPSITGKIIIDKNKFEKYKIELVDLEKVKTVITDFDFKARSTGEALDLILAGALLNRASDIHTEPEEKKVKIRYRIDGLLYDATESFPIDVYPRIISRFKLLSGLKINVSDRPQDGRFTISVAEKEIEIRISIAPAEFGETIVMRILDPSAIQLNLADLGFRNDDLEIIRTQLNEPNGIIFNTGPTGSGKTTTLYGFLNHVKNPELKIITIEDPIEYHLEGLEQTQVDPEAGYTFATGLRSLMRQDPDIILVGEVRDKETAEIAIQAALTGHLVFSTIHANSAAGAIPRLLDLGVKAVSIAPALNLIIAQRLVRRLCSKCKAAQKIQKTQENKIGQFINKLPQRVNREDYKEIKIFKPVGCPACNNLGYKGRAAVLELLEITDEMEEMIKAGVGETEIQKHAVGKGMITMQQDGVLKVISGTTTFEEVEAVTGRIIDLWATNSE
jgi:type IV pilus assembly protein PilB